MLRSLYSGVAGLKTQQTKMDVIGNNIANVGTYGYKSSRATFKDVYYQTTSSATAATGDIGGTNAKQIGYGNSVGSIDTNTQTSAMSSTGYNLDVAITGEGYLQVMGVDGNIMYTKAGMLDIDAEGNLVDINGNFVLGVSGDISLPPSSNKIQVSLPFLDPAPASITDTINNVDYTIVSANATNKANLSFTFTASNALPIGQKVGAKVSGSSVVVTLNSNEVFENIDELNTLLNQAITDANGGIEHPAGAFSIISSSPEKFDGLTGAQIVSTDFGYDAGTVSMPEGLRTLFGVESVADHFTGNTEDNTMEVIVDEASDGNVTIRIGNYEGSIKKSQMTSAGTLMLTNGGDTKDSFIISYPSMVTLQANLGSSVLPAGGNNAAGATTYTAADTVDFTNSEKSKSLGLGQSAFRLKGGTEGGEQTVANLTGISINPDGVLVGVHDIYGTLELGRIDLATFANPAGLAKVGNTYFETTLNSGDPIVVNPGTEGTGQLMASTLESSNVDLSSEFSDMIMTQRGFQASSRVITVSDTLLEELINLKR
ncbi:MAG: flagellar hook-basal body complex protein [Ruminococcus sp.]|nr:flagellar hook-basal body complex protein [Ruminococcus sp.]